MPPRRDPGHRACASQFIPMLNPDGVFDGCYRADMLGVNLNRTYASCTPEAQPSIFGATSVVRQLHER
eukprot:1802209-Prymnesium_polylepis.1